MEDLEARKLYQILPDREAAREGYIRVDVYREKVGSPCLALENEESRTSAVEPIRTLIEAIMLQPDGDKLNSR